MHVWFNPQLQGFYSRKLCCFWCRALAWTNITDNEQDVEYLYTNFGPQAAHRSTLLGLLAELVFHVLKTVSNENKRAILFYSWKLLLAQMILKPQSPVLSRLVTREEWMDISVASPLCDIPGWDPWRSSAKKTCFLSAWYTWFSKVSKVSQITDHCQNKWLFG